MGAPNASGLTRVALKLKGKFAAILHNHAASDITSGILALARGGTGSDTAAGARTSLSVPSTTDLADVVESIADVEQSTATANHAIGDHFMLGNELRKATSAIASGESITSSNSATDTVQGQIDSLRDSVGVAKIEKLHWLTGITTTTVNTDFTHHVTFNTPLAGTYNRWGFVQVLGYSNGFTVALSSLTTTGVDLICNSRDTWGHEVIIMIVKII